VRRSSAGTFLWQNPQDSYNAFTNLDYGSRAADTWHEFSATDKAITVTKGTPYRLQVGYGSDENKDFTFYLADFSIAVKTGTIAYDVLADFEGAAPTITALDSATVIVVNLSEVTELSPAVSSGKALKIVHSGYNQGAVIAVTLPAALSGYTSLVFDGAVISGTNVTYKKVSGLVAAAITQFGDASSTGFWGSSKESVTTVGNFSTSAVQTALVQGEIALTSFSGTLTGSVALGIGIETDNATFIVDNIRLSKPAFTVLPGVTHTVPAN
jgi:hypothetical protein